jgi:hypothetical protein
MGSTLSPTVGLPVPSEGLVSFHHASEAGGLSCPGMLYGRATVPQPAGCGSP